MHPAMFGLHEDGSELELDPEWHALRRQEARTLAAMLQRRQIAVAGRQRLTEIQTLAADTAQCLAAQAQHHVRLEHELVPPRALVTELSQAPAEMTQRVPRRERVIAALHANLAAARQ